MSTMSNGFTLKEAAAITEVPESVVRTAIEKKVIAPRSVRVGKAVRYAFDVRELYYAKLLSAFPLAVVSKNVVHLIRHRPLLERA